MDYFSSLCEKYPTWEDMKTYLESAKCRIVGPNTGESLVVIRYEMGQRQTHGQFRSVVWNTATNRPVCYAPPAAAEGQPPLKTDFALIQDFVDGFMVNVFLMREDPATLRLATRTQLGGNNTFYSNRPFAELFDEALATTPIRTQDALKMHLREAMERADADSIFVSFVVQHPEHRIVAKPVSPALHIVHIGTVDRKGIVAVDETAETWPAALKRLQITRYPSQQFHSEQEIQDLMRRTAVNNGFRWQGLVFKDGAGKRWRLRSPSYMMLRTLRGPEAFAADRFLRLRREGKVLEYLKHYNEERKVFWGLEQTLRARTADAFAAYEQVHKAHTMKFADLPAAYKPIVHLLHVKFLGELREKGFKVILRNAVEVVNGLRAYEQKRLLTANEFVVPTVVPVAEAVAAGSPSGLEPAVASDSPSGLEPPPPGTEDEA